jgi:hypothetical protein
MKISEYNKVLKEHTKNATDYKLTGDDKQAHEFFAGRKEELKLYRRHSGVETIWRAADKAYQPHTIRPDKKAVLVSDDELGWRSTKQVLGTDDEWMEDSIAPNPYVKIQTALGIIVDRNPSGVFIPTSKKYVNNTALVEDLYKQTWVTGHSKSAFLKPFVFNQAKYGLGVGRTYPLKLKRNVDDLVKFNPTGKNVYKTVEQVYYDDVFRESLSPWQCWFDDAGTVGNPYSFNDNMWYKDYSWQKFIEIFGNLPNFKYVVPTKQVLHKEENIEKNQTQHSSDEKSGISKYQIRLWFYENLELDRLLIETNDGIVLVNEPLPQKPKNKHLSLYGAPWTLRDDKTIYGIGVYESMRGDHKLHTKIRQMTMDQLVLSIYKEWFYEGTDTLQGDGIMKTRPGKGRQVINPQNIKWNEIPGPGQEAWLALDRQEQKIEEATGITRNLTGEVVGKTAYETAQARESALKRLKTPLENLTDALETEAYITLSIIEDLYSIPKIKLLAEDRYIDAVDLESMKDKQGELPEYVEEYRELPTNLNISNEGSITKSNKQSFISLRPELLPWEGMIKIRGESVVAESELLDRMTTTEMANLIIPLLMQPPEIVKKPVIEILKVYKKDPKDWVPDSWLQEQNQLFNPLQQKQEMQPDQMQSMMKTPTVIPQSEISGITTPDESLKKTL